MLTPSFGSMKKPVKTVRKLPIKIGPTLYVLIKHESLDLKEVSGSGSKASSNSGMRTISANISERGNEKKQKVTEETILLAKK